MTEGLHADSKFYGSALDWYLRLSDAEDALGKVFELLADYVRGKRVLDFGCGVGKYIPLLSPLAASYLCFDRSVDALKIALERARGFKNVTILHPDPTRVPLNSKSVDIVIACWVFGTINNESERSIWLDECNRVLSDKGEIILIENDIGGEFETIRRRYPDSSRTLGYNTWLETKGGFKLLSRFNTEFCFASLKAARAIFGAIWGEQASASVKTSRIEHRIAVYALR